MAQGGMDVEGRRCTRRTAGKARGGHLQFSRDRTESAFLRTSVRFPVLRPSCATRWRLNESVSLLKVGRAKNIRLSRDGLVGSARSVARGRRETERSPVGTRETTRRATHRRRPTNWAEPGKRIFAKSLSPACLRHARLRIFRRASPFTLVPVTILDSFITLYWVILARRYRYQ